ncbi:MAG: ADP-ribosylglycohydrolase family protein [Anaerolineales bacterium]|nr:ADP-ribosylglycohydrolase family protein [Anaerolineales bacterium]
MDNLQRGILGSLAGVATGDALGMPVHELTSEEIRERCGGPVDRMLDPFDDEFIHLDYRAGQYTDDTILTLVTVKAILGSQDRLTSVGMADALADWASRNEAVWQHGLVFGPSTKHAFATFMDGNRDFYLDRSRTWCYQGTSDGAVMRIAPAGWVCPGDLEAAVELACEAVLPTHPSHVALSAASAQASAVAEALTEKADVSSVADAALRGARLGDVIGRKKARVVAQPETEPRLELALELAEKAGDAFEAGLRIQRLIGTHFHATEALSAALGIFVAAKGDPRTAMIAAATTGGDTDTIASITGALAGALRGIDAIPAEWVEQVEAVNGISLTAVAEDVVAYVNAKR